MEVRVRPMTDEERADKAASIQRFKSNFDSYQSLIRKCFTYLYTRRYPSQEGDVDAYNLLLLRLYELDVFEKFDIRKVVAKRKGISKKRAHTLSDRQCDAKSLKALGIKPEKKFEQFMFKYIEHILQEAYSQRLKQSQRFLNYEELAHEPPRSSTELWARLNESRWAQSKDEIDLLENHLARKDRNGHSRAYPTYVDRGSFVGTPAEDPLEEMVEQDLTDKIHSVVTSDRDERVLELTMDGVSGTDIAQIVGCSPQNVNLILKRVREKLATYLQEQDAAVA